MWVYCGGRTTGAVVEELNRHRTVKGYEMVEDVLKCKSDRGSVQGVIVTDMALGTLLDWEEVRKLSNKFKGARILSVTTREGGIPLEGSLPVNVEIERVDKVRVESLVVMMEGGEG